MPSELKSRIQEDVKSAMRAKDRERLGVLRLITSAIKQREVDERIELDDAGVLGALDKMLKQRRESARQYDDAGRDDLAGQERYEMEIISAYMPQPLTGAEIDALIAGAVAETGAGSIRDMGRVMGVLKPALQGRADMGAVSAAVKARLSD